MSEADSLWYLRHRDGVEHGPFQLADLVSAAQAGNVAADTCVRHEVHTRAQWVVATRVQPIAQGMSRQAEASAAQAQPPPARQSVHQPPRMLPAEEKPEQPDEPDKRTPQERTSSVFRGSRPAVANASRETPADSPETSGATEESVVTTSIRPLRDPAFPVPKTFVSAVQALCLDFQFKRFVTPWIVKILWAISLLLAILSIVALGYNFFLQPSMSAATGATDNGKWQFGPMNEQPLLLMRIVIFMITALLTTMILLCIRVVCEMVIVAFQAGGDVRELRKLLKQPKP